MTRVERRGFIVGTLSLLAAPLAAETQQTGRVYRIGILSALTRTWQEEGWETRWWRSDERVSAGLEPSSS